MNEWILNGSIIEIFFFTSYHVNNIVIVTNTFCYCNRIPSIDVSSDILAVSNLFELKSQNQNVAEILVLEYIVAVFDGYSIKE